VLPADGWAGVVWGYCLSVAVIFQMTFLVNSVGHLFGTQRFDTGDGSRNNLFLGTFGLGDGWHNNHHRAPASARHGFAWYEFDMTYTVIKLWRRMGLVWGVKVPPAEVLRGEDHRRRPAEAAPTPPAEAVA
jgi:stearoyl-CoA desaturase (delta-9 desaturase)